MWTETKQRASQKAHYVRNKERILSSQRKGRAPKDCAHCGATYQPTGNYSLYCVGCRRVKNREHARHWRSRHPEQNRAFKLKNQGERRLGRDPEAVAYADILRRDLCCYCGAPSEQIDHIEPVIHGGPNDWDNLTASCRSCNASKKDKSLLGYLVKQIEITQGEVVDA